MGRRAPSVQAVGFSGLGGSRSSWYLAKVGVTRYEDPLEVGGGVATRVRAEHHGALP